MGAVFFSTKASSIIMDDLIDMLRYMRSILAFLWREHITLSSYISFNTFKANVSVADTKTADNECRLYFSYFSIETRQLTFQLNCNPMCWRCVDWKYVTCVNSVIRHEECMSIVIVSDMKNKLGQHFKAFTRKKRVFEL